MGTICCLNPGVNPAPLAAAVVPAGAASCRGAIPPTIHLRLEGSGPVILWFSGVPGLEVGKGRVLSAQRLTMLGSGVEKVALGRLSISSTALNSSVSLSGLSSRISLASLVISQGKVKGLTWPAMQANLDMTLVTKL